MKTSKQIIGKMGEDYACEYYIRNGCMILDRNYLRKWGEIDIIATNKQKIFFIEVKTVTRSYICNIQNDTYHAEDNVHPYKIKRLKRTIQTYLLDHKYNYLYDWQFDLMVVVFNKDDLSLDKIQKLENIII